MKLEASFGATGTMTTADSRSIRTALRSAWTIALKQRDRNATSVYRGALGAFDNAEAMPVGSEHRAGAIEGSAVGVGSTTFRGGR